MNKEIKQHNKYSSSKKKLLILFAALAAVVLLPLAKMLSPEVVAGEKIAWHSFDYGGYGENVGIEILNYRYGNSSVAVTEANKESMSTGKIPQGNGVGGKIPVGDFLYVKWRVLATGKEYEDTVDLKSRLPQDMDGKVIHFAIKESQLYVYLIEGNDSKIHLHAKMASDCPSWPYRMFKCSMLYPSYWKNF